MYSIKLEDNKNIIKEYVEVFHDIHTCEQFEMYSKSYDWFYCPVCLEPRGKEGHIKHKKKDLVIN